jgi:hypothetical protein
LYTKKTKKRINKCKLLLQKQGKKTGNTTLVFGKWPIHVYLNWKFGKYNNRLSGKILMYIIDYWKSCKIDTIEDI